MATLDELLTPKPGKDELPAYRAFLKDQRRNAHFQLLAQQAEIASRKGAANTTEAEQAARADELRQWQNGADALVAKYNAFDQMLSGLPPEG